MTEESIKEFIDNLKIVWEKIRVALIKVCKFIIGFMFNRIGYKRLVKSELINYYKSISDGKSNNWRKVHGLSMIRN